MRIILAFNLEYPFHVRPLSFPISHRVTGIFDFNRIAVSVDGIERILAGIRITNGEIDNYLVAVFQLPDRNLHSLVIGRRIIFLDSEDKFL